MITGALCLIGLALLGAARPGFKRITQIMVILALLSALLLVALIIFHVGLGSPPGTP